MADKARTLLSWEDAGGQARWMLFDIVETVSHGSSTEVTDSPVEDGSLVSDHAYNGPDVVSILGVVSNTPLPSNPGVGEPHPYNGKGALMSPTVIEFNLPEVPARAPIYTPGGLTEGIGKGIGKLTDALFGGSSDNQAAGVYVADSPTDRVAEAFQILRSLKRSFAKVTIETALHKYEGMIVTALNVDEEVTENDTKSFSLEFRELQTGSLLTNSAPAPSEVRAAPSTKGIKALKEPKDKEKKLEKAEGRPSSGLVKIIGALVG